MQTNCKLLNVFEHNYSNSMACKNVSKSINGKKKKRKRI